MTTKSGSIDEQDRIMGRQLRILREKERERKCLISKARNISERLMTVLEFLVKGDHTSLPNSPILDELPSREEIVNTAT